MTTPATPELPELPETVAGLLRQRAGDDRVGLRFEDVQWSWREVVHASEQRATWLRSERRDGPFHIGVLLENVPEFLFLLGGAALAGACVVGVNPTRRGDELAHDIRHTDCQLVLTDASGAALLEDLDLGSATGRVVRVDTPAYLDAVAACAPDQEAALPDPDSLYLLLFTSGSTGTPKAVRMTQGRAARTAQRSVFGPDDVLYCSMPLFHGNSLHACVFPSMLTGASLVLRRRFSASAFLDDLRHYDATFFNTVGRALAYVLATPPTEHDRDHCVKYGLGPESAPSDIKAFRARFGIYIVEGYGSSENAIIMQPVPGMPKGALGEPLDGLDVVVMHPDTKQECPRARFDEHGVLLNAEEAIGELVSRSAVDRFEGYYNNPAAEAERTRDGLYWSGDLAYRDEEGWFWFAGRNADWLRVDGENFAAAPVERILGRFPSARGVAVYGVPDPVTGDQVMAAIEVDPAVGFDPAAFTRFLDDQRDLGTKWRPRFVRLVEQLPLTATNKVAKLPLRAQRWDTTDPLWWQPGRNEPYRPMTDDDRAALLERFRTNGRATLIDRA